MGHSKDSCLYCEREGKSLEGLGQLFVMIGLHFDGNSLADLRRDRMRAGAGRLFLKSRKKMLRIWTKVVAVEAKGNG